MPPSVLGDKHAEKNGDCGSTEGPLPVAGELAWSVHNGLTTAGFDVSLSYSLTVDHGIVQTYEMLTGGTTLPMVPLVVNTAAPPLPTLDRCLALGRALGATLRSASFPGRVLVAASGGLSHWLPSNDPREVAGERRESLIHGRSDVRAFAAAREPRVRAMGGDPSARVNTEWDRWFLARLGADDAGAVAGLGHEALEASAGRGGHEVRCWLIGQVAAGAPLVWTGYEPVPEWITGMGIGTTFPVP